MKYRSIVRFIRGRGDDDRRPAENSSSATPAPSMPNALSDKTPPTTIPSQMSSEITQKWRALAEQRHAHFVELQQSGRWKLYYSEHDFLVRMREGVHLLESWNTLTTPAAEEKRASEA